MYSASRRSCWVWVPEHHLSPHTFARQMIQAPPSRRGDLGGKINHRTAPLLPGDAGRALHLRNKNSLEATLIDSWRVPPSPGEPAIHPSSLCLIQVRSPFALSLAPLHGNVHVPIQTRQNTCPSHSDQYSNPTDHPWTTLTLISDP